VPHRLSDDWHSEFPSTADFLEPFSSEEVRELGLQHPDIHLTRGEFLFNPEEDKEILYVLKEGRIRVYKTNSEGRELTLGIVEPGIVFGEMALTAHKLQDAYAQAMEPSVAIPMTRVELEHLLLEKPQLALRMVYLFSERLRLYQNQMEDISLKYVPSRLASLITRLIESEGVMSPKGYKIPTRYTHQQLGTMIGTSREAVTKAFAQLQDEGVVELFRRYIHVKDIEALERIAKHSGS
jgi:CRP/FNR family transcriptional regulator, cyclic AMP receptor protein